jgi:CheY-like chemotaxis protein
MPRVLVVDPSPADLDFLESILERGGWEVTGAGSAPRACERLSRKSFDLVVVAAPMGRRSGLALVSAVRARGIPVLMTVSDDEMGGYAETMGVSFLAKPFYVDQFMSAVESAMKSGEQGTAEDEDHPPALSA